MKNYSFITEKTSTGFSAHYEDLDGSVVATTGDTIDELTANALDALNLHLEYKNISTAELKDILIVTKN